jgi:hypothetical protein
MPYKLKSQRRPFFAKELPEHVKKAQWNRPAAIDSVTNRADSLYNSLSKSKFVSNKVDSAATGMGFSGGKEAIRRASLQHHYMKNAPRTDLSKSQSDSVDVAIKDSNKGEKKLWNLANSGNVISRGINAADVAQHAARKSGYAKNVNNMLARTNSADYNLNVVAPSTKGVAATPKQKQPEQVSIAAIPKER